MLCKYPFYSKTLAIKLPCGQCLPCRINRRRAWTTRIFLESLYHENNVFITLTYAPQHLPTLPNGGAPILVKRDLQLFWKRLRKAIFPRKIRYYACGEYGERFGRPHYHAIIFGLSRDDDIYIDNAWQLGMTQTAEFNRYTAEYVAGYVSKKYTKEEKDAFKAGYQKEFSAMSTKPAIGASALPDLAKNALVQGGIDVINHLMIGGKRYPVPRYIQDKLRLMLFDEEYIEALKQAKLKNLRIANIFKDPAVERQKQINLETRWKLYNNRHKGEV